MFTGRMRRAAVLPCRPVRYVELSGEISMQDKNCYLAFFVEYGISYSGLSREGEWVAWWHVKQIVCDASRRAMWASPTQHRRRRPVVSVGAPNPSLPILQPTDFLARTPSHPPILFKVAYVNMVTSLAYPLRQATGIQESMRFGASLARLDTLSNWDDLRHKYSRLAFMSRLA